MSKLSDLIGTIGRGRRSMGFSLNAKDEPIRHILVAARADTAPAATAAVAAGATVLVVPAAALATVREACPSTPIGVTASEDPPSSDGSEPDFVIVELNSPATSILPRDAQDEGPGRVLSVPPGLPDEELSALSLLRTEALHVHASAEPLSLRDMLMLRRIRRDGGSPLMIESTAAPSTQMLQVWRDAGTAIVLVSGDAASVASTAEAAAGVPAPARRREERTPLLPVPDAAGIDSF